MDMDNITEFFSEKSILITGATGFISKILVEKILRIQPNVKKLYLLIRAKDDQSALQDRLHNEILGKDLFNVLREKLGTGFDSFIAQKVTPVLGDASLENLGISIPDREKLWMDVDIIVHGAAATDFLGRYDAALAMNTLGAKHMVDFANKCVKLQMFLHVSTAYLCGEKSGLIPERQLEMGETINGRKLDIDAEKQLVDQILIELEDKQATEKAIRRVMRDLGNERARLYGWQNAYEFTKAMGEMLIGQHRNNLPLVIVRPTIVSSTYREPFPGWIEGIRTIDSVAVAYGKGKLHFLLADKKCVFDLVPADMVVNSIIVSMVAHANQYSSITIYHVGTSFRNPVTFNELHQFHYEHYQKNPWTNREGKTVKIAEGFTLTSTFIIDIFFLLWSSVIIKVLKLVDAACFHHFQDSINYVDRQIRVARTLIDIFKPYLFFKGIFEDHNSEKLRVAARNHGVLDEDAFNFDPKSIIWEDYFKRVHIPAIMKYLF